MDPPQAAGLGNNRKLPRNVVTLLRGKKGKIQVAEIMINGPAAGKPPRKPSSAGLKRRNVALPLGILIAPNYDRVAVPPQIQDQFPGLHCLQQQLLTGEIAVGIGTCGVQPQRNGERHLLSSGKSSLAMRLPVGVAAMPP